jgi:hypothetical protein
VDGGNVDWDESGELRCPMSHRLTLAPPPWKEVLVEDVTDDNSSDSDDSCDRGECFVTHSRSVQSKDVEDRLDASKLKEDFWSSAGFPVGSRWWEECSINPVTPVTKNPSVGPTDLEQDKIVIEPNPTDTGQTKHQAMGGSNVNQWHGRTGVPMRPWHGPLPHPRPTPVVVLGDFLPFPLQTNLENRTFNPTGNLCSILGHEDLILLAKSYGRPSLNLESHRADRVTYQQGWLGLSERKPPPVDTPSIEHCKPNYVAMAARPPQTAAWGPT